MCSRATRGIDRRVSPFVVLRRHPARLINPFHFTRRRLPRRGTRCILGQARRHEPRECVRSIALLHPVPKLCRDGVEPPVVARTRKPLRDGDGHAVAQTFGVVRPTRRKDQYIAWFDDSLPRARTLGKCRPLRRNGCQFSSMTSATRRADTITLRRRPRRLRQRATTTRQSAAATQTPPARATDDASRPSPSASNASLAPPSRAEHLRRRRRLGVQRAALRSARNTPPPPSRTAFEPSRSAPRTSHLAPLVRFLAVRERPALGVRVSDHARDPTAAPSRAPPQSIQRRSFAFVPPRPPAQHEGSRKSRARVGARPRPPHRARARRRRKKSRPRGPLRAVDLLPRASAV